LGRERRAETMDLKALWGLGLQLRADCPMS
jgi:hypothetical protein